MATKKYLNDKARYNLVSTLIKLSWILEACCC